jgi:hypothetical protein
VVAHNEGSHICPRDYQITVEVVMGLFNTHVAWPGNITGQDDLGVDETEYDLDTSIWTFAHPEGIYRAKITFDTRYDSDLSDNIIYSRWFTIIK